MKSNGDCTYKMIECDNIGNYNVHYYREIVTSKCPWQLHDTQK